MLPDQVDTVGRSVGVALHAEVVKAEKSPQKHPGLLVTGDDHCGRRGKATFVHFLRPTAFGPPKACLPVNDKSTIEYYCLTARIEGEPGPFLRRRSRVARVRSGLPDPPIGDARGLEERVERRMVSVGGGREDGTCPVGQGRPELLLRL